MTDREKQIIEMTKIIFDNYAGGLYAKCDKSANALYNAGYRKMDEVTLKLDLGDRSAEEIRQIAEAFANEPTTAILVPSNESEIRKQVAKEILGEIRKNLNANGQYPRYEISTERFEILKQKYGVEIEK